MKYKKINEIERKMIFEAHQEDRNWREVARSLGVNEKTAYVWLRNEQASPKRRGGSQTKKTQAIVDFLTSLIEEKPSLPYVKCKKIYAVASISLWASIQ